MYLILWLAALGRRRQRLKETFIFGYGTVGTRQDTDDKDIGDLLGFEKSASGIRIALDKHLKNPVSVFALNGEMGGGKSTYWRVIAEGFDGADKYRKLHTYISLTETNSEKDFSKLFAERWFDTLSQRYPILFNFSSVKHIRLYNILRDYNGGFLKYTLELLAMSNLGLFRTLSAYREEQAETEKKFTDSTVSRMFGYIPQLYEDQWFIVIDELERAPFDEMYRVIEVIERFKQQAKAGFPLRITFVLCIDTEKLDKLIDNHGDLTEKSSLIRDFIMENAKNIDFRAVLPAQDVNTKMELIKKKLRAVLPEDVGVDTSGLRADIWDEEKNTFKPIEPVTPRLDGVVDPYRRYSLIVRQLTNETPRVALKAIEQVRFQIEPFVKEEKSWVFNHRVSEYLIFSYLMAKSDRVLIDIAKEVFVQLGPDEATRSFHELSDPRAMGLEEDKPVQVRERLFKIYGFDYRYLENDDELRKMLEPLAVFIPRVYKKIVGDNTTLANDEVQYRGTLSERSLFLSLVNFSEVSDEATAFLKWFDDVKRGIWSGGLDTAKEICDFSGFVRNRVSWQDRPKSSSLFVANHIMDYIQKPNEEKLFKPGSVNIDENMLDKLMYELIFHLIDAFELNNEPSSQNEECIKLMERLIQSSKVTIEAKLIFVDAFLRTGSSEQERMRTIERIIQSKRSKSFLSDMFHSVQADMEKRYGGARGGVTIHNSEANVFYVLHQSWDGKAGGDSNLRSLRLIARKGLKAGSYGLETLWSVYPFNPVWSSYSDFKRDDTNAMFFVASERGRYISLSELLHYSDNNKQFKVILGEKEKLRDTIAFWRKVAEDKEFQQDEGDVKKDRWGVDTVAGRVAAKVEEIRNVSERGR